MMNSTDFFSNFFKTISFRLKPKCQVLVLTQYALSMKYVLAGHLFGSAAAAVYAVPVRSSCSAYKGFQAFASKTIAQITRLPFATPAAR